MALSNDVLENSREGLCSLSYVTVLLGKNLFPHIQPERPQLQSVATSPSLMFSLPKGQVALMLLQSNTLQYAPHMNVREIAGN